MNYQDVHRLTDEEHGTLNAALISYADDTEDASEAEAVHNLAEMIISSDVHLYSKLRSSRGVSAGSSELRGRATEQHKENDNA